MLATGEPAMAVAWAHLTFNLTIAALFLATLGWVDRSCAPGCPWARTAGQLDTSNVRLSWSPMAGVGRFATVDVQTARVGTR